MAAAILRSSSLTLAHTGKLANFVLLDVLEGGTLRTKEETKEVAHRWLRLDTRRIFNIG